MKTKSRKAVSPIIATLILVAIAVVGGVMVFLFTQGYISSSSTKGPSIETVTMTGYDLRETSASVLLLTDQLGTGITGVVDPAASASNNIKNLGEPGVIYIKNIGSAAVVISKIVVNGRSWSSVQTTAIATPYTSATVGQVNVYKVILPTDVKTTLAAVTTISLNPGEEATLVGQFGSDSSSGTTVAVEIATSGGNAFKFSAVAGQKG